MFRSEQRKSQSWKHASQHSRRNISRFRKTYARRCRREPILPPSLTPFAYPYPPLLRNRSISPEVTTASQKMGGGKRSRFEGKGQRGKRDRLAPTDFCFRRNIKFVFPPHGGTSHHRTNSRDSFMRLTLICIIEYKI